MNLVFDRQTGHAACVLLDEGYLTNVRTAGAGAVVAKYLAPREVNRIGVLGTGVQARLQVQYLAPIIASRRIIVWGRRQDAVERYSADMSAAGYRVESARDPQKVAESSNFIITATAATAPLLTADVVRKGTHISAMGSDTPDKIGLDPRILARADLVVADSINQCVERGEIANGVAAGILSISHITELGKIVANPRLGRSHEEQITVADLTGVAVQDIQISKAVYRNLVR